MKISISEFLSSSKAYPQGQSQTSPQLFSRWVTHVGQHECIVCPYHGWAFDVDGVLRDVPAAETSKEWPTKPMVSSYPVQEKVWLKTPQATIP